MTDPAAVEHLSILHLDMDAFFAAVEVLADPTLAGRPVIVGGSGSRGVVASCSYEARAYGVRSAMPSVQASRLCPEAIFLPGRFDAYSAVSRSLHGVLTSFTPLVEGIGLDEAFLDVHGAHRLFGSGPEIGRAVRGRVHDELGLWSSVPGGQAGRHPRWAATRCGRRRRHARGRARLPAPVAGLRPVGGRAGDGGPPHPAGRVDGG